MSRVKYIGGGQFVFRGQNVGSDFNFPGVARDIGWSLSRVQKRNGVVKELARKPRGYEHSESV